MIGQHAPSGANLLNLNGDTVQVSMVGGAAVTETVTRIMGLTLSEWFYIAAIIYTLFIIIDKGVDIYKKAKYKSEWTIEDDRVRIDAKSKNRKD